MRKPLFFSALLISLLVSASSRLSLVAPGQEPASMPETMAPPAKPAKPAGPLKISYAGKEEEWTAATLAALPHTNIQVYNEHAKANQSYNGVLLSTLLGRVGVPASPRGKDFRLYLVARGSDGYEVVYSVGEVSPDVHDATILVADARDGKPLGDSGPLQLVATGEKRPARWVRNLVEIRVLTAE